MKSPPRFYAPDMTKASATVVLPEDEARHLSRVLRLGVGASVQALNGRGLLRAAQVASAGKGDVVLDLGAEVPAAVESRTQVTLAQALLKGDKMDDVVRDATMAGAVAIQPIVTAHTEPALARIAQRRLERWHAVAVGSAKQSGRAVVPTLEPARPVDEVLSAAQGVAVVLVEPSASAGPAIIATPLPRPEQVTLFVGPEGGWAPDELQRFRDAGATLATLPGPTWRADAIGLIGIVLIDMAWEGREGWSAWRQTRQT